MGLYNHEDPEQAISTALKKLTAQGVLHRGGRAVGVSVVSDGKKLIDTVQMREV